MKIDSGFPEVIKAQANAKAHWVAMHRPEKSVHGGYLEQQERKAPAAWRPSRMMKIQVQSHLDLPYTASHTCREKTENSCEGQGIA